MIEIQKYQPFSVDLRPRSVCREYLRICKNAVSYLLRWINNYSVTFLVGLEKKYPVLFRDFRE